MLPESGPTQDDANPPEQSFAGSDPGLAAQEAEPPPPIPPTARYCGKCGSLRDPLTGECPTCTAAPGAAPPLDAEGNPIASGIVLYLLLLGTSLATWLFSLTGYSAMLGIEAADACLVLVWAIVHRRFVSPSLQTSPGPRWYLAAIGLSVGTFLLATLAMDVLVRLLHISELQLAAPLIEYGCSWRAVVLLTCIQPAIVEELAFRGIILPAMARFLTAREAMIISAFMFMLLHLTVASFPHLLVIGLALGFLRVRTGSLYPCVLMHFCHNLWCILAEISTDGFDAR